MLKQPGSASKVHVSVLDRSNRCAGFAIEFLIHTASAGSQERQSKARSWSDCEQQHKEL